MLQIYVDFVAYKQVQSFCCLSCFFSTNFGHAGVSLRDTHIPDQEAKKVKIDETCKEL